MRRVAAIETDLIRINWDPRTRQRSGGTISYYSVERIDCGGGFAITFVAHLVRASLLVA